MSRVCDICGKEHMKGNKVCFSNKKSNKAFKVNIQKVKMEVNGKEQSVKACTKCIKTSKKAK